MSNSIGFDHAYFPHLLSEVIAGADHSTLLALRQTSSSVAREVDRRLFRHALVMRPRWPPAASPLFVGGASAPRQLPIPRGDGEGERARLAALLAQIQVVDDVSGGILVGWRKDLAPATVRRKGLAEQTLSAPSVIDAVDVPYNDNANWVVTASMQRVPPGTARYTAHIRCLSPPEGTTELGPANVKFGRPLPDSVRDVTLLFTPVGVDCKTFEPLHYYHELDGRKVNMLSIVVEQIADDLAQTDDRRYTFVGLEDVAPHVYDRTLGNESVQDNLRRRLHEQLELEALTDRADELAQRVRILTKAEYRREVGEERYELEAEWNGVVGAPRCL